MANSLLYLLPEIVGTNESSEIKISNIWYSFLQLLLCQKKDETFQIDTSRFEKYFGIEGNWVDIEGLIQKSIEIRIQEDYFKQGIFSVSKYFDVFSLASLLTMDINDNHPKPKEEIYELVWKDFLDFKRILCGYLNFIKNKTENIGLRLEKASIDYSKIKNDANAVINFTDFEKIINFNYTNFWLPNLDVYYVHGNIDDLKNVVFGLDMNIRGGILHDVERKTTFEININKNKQLLRFSKISQLLHLQVDKISNPLNIITSLSIVGHSIGEQDYSYYFSILDRNVDSIQIICFWYEYNEGGNNKESMKDALFDMLTNYERYSNQRILHKMIFEGRIKFKEVYIPKISIQ